jgi:hypothetical protein
MVPRPGTTIHRVPLGISEAIRENDRRNSQQGLPLQTCRRGNDSSLWSPPRRPQKTACPCPRRTRNRIPNCPASPRLARGSRTILFAPSLAVFSGFNLPSKNMKLIIVKSSKDLEGGKPFILKRPIRPRVDTSSSFPVETKLVTPLIPR